MNSLVFISEQLYKNHSSDNGLSPSQKVFCDPTAPPGVAPTAAQQVAMQGGQVVIIIIIIISIIIIIIIRW